MRIFPIFDFRLPISQLLPTAAPFRPAFPSPKSPPSDESQIGNPRSKTLHDLRLALRHLARASGHTVVVVLTLVFGIAVNTNILGFVGAIFLQRMPVPDADRIVLVTRRCESWPTPHAIAFPDLQGYLERLRSMESLPACQPMPARRAACIDPCEALRNE